MATRRPLPLRRLGGPWSKEEGGQGAVPRLLPATEHTAWLCARVLTDDVPELTLGCTCKDGIDISKWVKPGAHTAKYNDCMIEGRNAMPLSELLEADEANRAKLRDTELIALQLYSGKKSFAVRRYGCLVVSILLHLPCFWRCCD
jgi:hypothetical protein